MNGTYQNFISESGNNMKNKNTMRNSLLLLTLVTGVLATTSALRSGKESSILSAAPLTIVKKASDEYIANYYQTIDESLTGKSLTSALEKLLKVERKANFTYKSLQYDAFPYTDVDPLRPNDGYIVSFYSGTPVKGYSGMNKEHTWPKSHGGNFVDNDPHMVRPTLSSENSARGNMYFAKAPNKGWDPGAESWGDKKYRGIAARIIFYSAVIGYSSGLQLEDVGRGQGTGTKSKMGKLGDLLIWNFEYPVDPSEIIRNETLDISLKYNRNPFIDDPTLACKIWGDTNSNTKNICNKYMQEDQKLVVTPSSSEVNINDTVKLEVAYEGGLAEGVAYESSNPSIASVSPAGVVTAHQVGSVTITVTSLINSSIKAEVTINIAEETVIEPPSSEETPVVIETNYYTFTDIEGNVTTDDEDTTKWNITSTNKPTKMGKNGIVLEEEQDNILFTTSRTYEKIEAFDLIYSTDNNVGKGQANLYALNNIDDQISGETLIGSVELPSTDGGALNTVGITLNPLAEALQGKYLAVEIEVDEAPIYFIGTNITEKKHANEGIITPPRPSKNHTGLIIGLSIGGVLLIGGTIFLIIYLRKRRAII